MYASTADASFNLFGVGDKLMNYAAQQAPLQGMANQMAQYGRYGDSMLVHMNPAEVQGILQPCRPLVGSPPTR